MCNLDPKFTPARDIVKSCSEFDNVSRDRSVRPNVVPGGGSILGEVLVRQAALYPTVLRDRTADVRLGVSGPVENGEERRLGSGYVTVVYVIKYRYKKFSSLTYIKKSEYI